MLGLDPLYVANEGVLVAIVRPELRGGGARRAPQPIRSGRRGSRHRHGSSTEHPGMVVLRTSLGGTRVVDMLPGDQLPRIC